MQTAWRERNPEARIKAAKEAIALNPECATAYILLAEEEASDITEAELKFKEAYRIAETNHRRSQQLQHQVQHHFQIIYCPLFHHYYFKSILEFGHGISTQEGHQRHDIHS